MQRTVKKWSTIVSLATALCFLLNNFALTVGAVPHYEFKKGSGDDGIVPVSRILFSEDFNKPLEKIKANETYFGTDKGENKLLVQHAGGISEVGSSGCITVSYAAGLENRLTLRAAEADKLKFSGTYSVEFKFRQDSLSAMQPLFQTYAEERETNFQTAPHPYIFTDKDGNVYHKGLNNVDTKLASIKGGAWYTFKLVINRENDTYDCYINGQPVGETLPFGGVVTSGVNEWNGGAVRFFNKIFVAACTTAGAKAYYDDILIYKEPVGRRTLYANDFTGYKDDVCYNATENVFGGFAGLGLETFGSERYAALNAQEDKVVFPSNGKMIIKDFNKIKNNAAFSFDLTINNTSEDIDRVYSMQENSGKSHGAKLILHGGSLMAVTKSGNVEIIRAVEANKTYNIIVHTDITKSHDGKNGCDSGECIGGNGTFDVYVDGECKASGLEIALATAENLTDLGRPLNINVSAKKEVSMKIGDMCLYQDVREEVMAEAGLFVQKSFSDEIISKVVEFPTSYTGFDGYKIKWNSSDSAVINPSTGVISGSEADHTVTLTAEVSDIAASYTIYRSFNVVVPMNRPVIAEVKIQDNNGASVKNHLFKCSIPFAKGVLTAEKELHIHDGSDFLPSDTEILETYDDGSVRWLLVSFVSDLNEGEIKSLYLTEGIQMQGLVSYNESTKTMSNSILSVTLSESGIKDITKNGVKVLTDDGIRLYLKENGITDFLKNGTVTLIKNSKSHVQARISGMVGDGIEGIIEVTLAAESDMVQVDYRINVKRDVLVESTGLKVGVEPSKPVSAHSGESVFDCGNMSLISYDNIRFNGAVEGSKTGFTAESARLVQVSPIINCESGGYTIYDGVSKTNHMYLCFSEAENQLAAVKNPPVAVIDPSCYANAGITYEVADNALLKEMLQTLKNVASQSYGRFEAGSIPGAINENGTRAASRWSRPGETEYNLGYGYMQTADPLIYNMLEESAESWADVGIYKGQYEEIYGANRTRTDTCNGDKTKFFCSHPYYGDPSGLYMAYILSGNEYLKEVFISSCEHLVKNMYNMDNYGNNIPMIWYWYNKEKEPYPADYAESRYMLIARPLYLAYCLTKDGKYKTAAYDIAQWGTDKQQPNGSWPQAYYHYKRVNNKNVYFNYDNPDDDKHSTVLIQGKQQTNGKYEGYEPYKVYIMLYGYRGISDMMQFEYNSDMKETLLKFANYLCSQNEQFGQGLTNPNGDISVYPENEGKTRGRCSMSGIMAVEVLARAYELGGDERHLKNMCSLYEHYLANSIAGFNSGGCSDVGYLYSGFGGSTGRCMTYLKSAGYIGHLLKENREKVCNLGYEDLMIASKVNSEKNDSKAELTETLSPLITQNIYTTDGKTVLFANVNLPLSDSGSGMFKSQTKDNMLWQGEGIDNVVKNKGNVLLEKTAECYDVITAMERPMRIKNNGNGEIHVSIHEYSPERVIFDVSGGGLGEIELSSGDFVISPTSKYVVTETQQSGGKRITITKGEGTALNADVLTISFAIGDYYTIDNFNSDAATFEGYTTSGKVTLESYIKAFDKSIKLYGGATIKKNITEKSNAYVIAQDLYISNSAQREEILRIGEICIEAKDGRLYYGNEEEPFAVAEQDNQFKLTVTYCSNECSIYVDGVLKREQTVSMLPNDIIYTCTDGTLYVDNVLLGCYSNKNLADLFCQNTLHRALTQEENAVILRLEKLKETKGESSAFFDKLEEIRMVTENRFAGEELKASYEDMLEKLETISLDETSWLVAAENFSLNSDSLMQLSTADSLGGSEMLSTANAAVENKNGVLRLQRNYKINTPTVSVASEFAGDDYTVNFRYMQPWKSSNKAVYCGGNYEGNDYSVQVQSTQTDFVCFERTGSENKTHLLIQNYKPGKWYDFRIAVHYLSKTYDVWVDGEEKVKDISFASLNEDYEQIDADRVFAALGYNDYSAYYYDDIYIYGKRPSDERTCFVKKDTYYVVRANVAYETLNLQNTPKLIACFYNESGEMIKILTAPIQERKLLSLKLEANEIPVGKYSIRAYLWNNVADLKPISKVSVFQEEN